MMTNYFIAPSVLAFPPKDKNKKEDIRNLTIFYEGLMYLSPYIRNPAKNPDAAFFLEESLENEFAGRGYLFIPGDPMDGPDQLERIKRMQGHGPHAPREIRKNLGKWLRSFFGYYQTDANSARGMKIIQFMTSDDHGQTKNSDEGQSHEHFLQQPYFKSEHKKLYECASRLEKVYQINKWSILARGSIPPKMRERFQTIKQFDEESKKQKYFGFSTLKSSFEKAVADFSSEITFGDDIKNDAIFNNTDYDKDNIPDRLFYYLETLSTIVKYLRKLPVDSRAAKGKEFNEIVKKFGGDSIWDTRKYSEKECQYRQWKVAGAPMLFLYHLKPFTCLHNLTMRVYYTWDNKSQKIIIGMICKHSHCCDDDCPKKDEC